MEGLWQSPLLSARRLSEVSTNNGTSGFTQGELVELWDFRLLQADIVRSATKLSVSGLVVVGEDRGDVIHSDRRRFVYNAGCIMRASEEEQLILDTVELRFHPFRCYVLLHLFRRMRQHVDTIHVLRDAQIERAISSNIERFDKWISGENTPSRVHGWNDLASLCVAVEPIVHERLFRRVRSSSLSYDDVRNRLAELSGSATKLFEYLGEKTVEQHRAELCQTSELLDRNKELHAVIRLMNAASRDRLVGEVSGAMLLFHMAESLRRVLEMTTKKEYLEEHRLGFGQARGTMPRLFDGRPDVANEFLRQFGLDQGIRVTVYVEGDTELAAIRSEFDWRSSVRVVNLRGRVVERKGKGVSFRESLRNDIKAQIFSIVVLDGDVEDNRRAVMKAASDDEICGMFFISSPDFEFANFSVRELCEIAIEVSGGSSEIDIEELAQRTEKCGTNKEFFSILCGLDGLAHVAKGEAWGSALGEYAWEHPWTEDVGSPNDRPINYITWVIYQCLSLQYEDTRASYRTDPQTGLPVERAADDANHEEVPPPPG